MRGRIHAVGTDEPAGKAKKAMGFNFPPFLDQVSGIERKGTRSLRNHGGREPTENVQRVTMRSILL